MWRMLYLEDDVHSMFDEVLWIKVRIHVCSQFVWWMRNSWLWLLWFWLFINFHGCSLIPAQWPAHILRKPARHSTSSAYQPFSLQSVHFLPLINISATYSTTILKCTITQWASARLSPTVHSGMLFNQAAVCSAVEPEQRQQRHILMCAGSVSCIRGYDSLPARLCPHCNAHSHPLQYQIRLLT